MIQISTCVNLHIVGVAHCGRQLEAWWSAGMGLIDWLGLEVDFSISHGAMPYLVLTSLMVVLCRELDFTCRPGSCWRTQAIAACANVLC